MYDVVIVGASIAGLYTGMKLAKNGFRVCIVDRRKKIGIPVRCGELTGNRCELSRFVDVDESWIARDISGLALHHNGELLFTKTVSDVGLVLHRDRFEQSLARKAKECGATICLEKAVTGLLWEAGECKGVHDEKGERFEGALVIGADGCESFIGQWAGITRTLPITDAYSSVQYRVKSTFCNDAYAHFFIGTMHIPQGYIWVFPKSENEISVGAGLYRNNTNSMKALDFLRAFIKKYLPDAECYDLISGCVPLSVCSRTFVNKNVLVVGDAARIVNPLTAGGIMNTLEAADIAATVIIKYGIKDLDEKKLNEYSRKWNRSQRRQQKIFYVGKELFLACSDKELVRIIKKISAVFSTAVDRTKPFSLPLVTVLQLCFIFMTRIIKHRRLIAGVIRA